MENILHLKNTSINEKTLILNNLKTQSIYSLFIFYCTRNFGGLCLQAHIQPHIETFLPKAKTTPSDLQKDYNKSDHGQKHATEDTLKQDHKTFQKTVYTPQKPMGVDKQEANRTQNDVNKKIEVAENKTNDALEAAKAQHVKARQTFKQDHAKHAEENMGFTQEGAAKDLLKNFEEKKKNG